MRSGDADGCCFAGLKRVSFFFFPLPPARSCKLFPVHSVSVIYDLLRMSINDDGSNWFRILAEPVIGPNVVRKTINSLADNDYRNQNDEPGQAGEPIFGSFSHTITLDKLAGDSASKIQNVGLRFYLFDRVRSELLFLPFRLRSKPLKIQPTAGGASARTAKKQRSGVRSFMALRVLEGR